MKGNLNSANRKKFLVRSRKTRPRKIASNSLGAPEDTQTSFNFNESYIGSLEATINSDFINIRL